MFLCCENEQASSSSSCILVAEFDRKFHAHVKEPDLVYVTQPGPLILSDGNMKGMTKLGAHHCLTSDTHALSNAHFPAGFLLYLAAYT